MSSKDKNNKKDKAQRAKNGSKKLKKGLPIWLTVFLFVLAALIMFVAGAVVYATQFHLVTGSGHQVLVPYWRSEYQREYHMALKLLPGGPSKGTAPTVLEIQPAVDAATPAVTQPMNNDETVNILVMGLDKVALNTDVIMLVNFDTAEGSLNILQIPRDTFYVDGRINTLMANKRKMAKNADPSLGNTELLKRAMKASVDSLKSSLGVNIDGYAIVDLAGFRQVIDILGGVYMDVPYAMHYDDPEQNLSIHLNAGPQTLNGQQAEMFVRYRNGYAQGDIGRVNAQKIFLTALFAELRNVDAADIPELAGAAIEHVTTDFDLADILKLATKFLGIDMSKISMMTLPGYHTVSSGGGSYYVMNRESAFLLINEYFLGSNDRTLTNQQFDLKRDFTSTQRNFTNIYDADKERYAAVVENADAISNGEMNAPPA